MAATNKSLAQSNKSPHRANATKKRKIKPTTKDQDHDTLTALHCNDPRADCVRSRPVRWPSNGRRLRRLRARDTELLPSRRTSVRKRALLERQREVPITTATNQAAAALNAPITKRVRALARQRACTLFDELRRKQMKIMITIIVTFIIVAIFQAPTSAVAQRTLAYDSQGNFSGTATTRGNVGTTYDRHGRFESRAIKRGNSVTFTNRDGSRFTVRAGLAR
jgi:hypothetical protein